MSRLRRLAGSPVFQFAWTGLLAFAIVAIVGTALLRKSARTEALRDAKNETSLAGRGIVSPELTRSFLRGNPDALARLDRVVRERVLVGSVVRVKIWSRTGEILYSDEPRLIGEHYDLGDDELEVLEDDSIEAEVSDLREPENRFERQFKELREVYMGIDAPGGRRLLFETYLQSSTIAANGKLIWDTFLPIFVGALALLWLAQLPIAASLTRRLRKAQRERESLLQSAVDASETERRRIARDLHDGVVQELAGAAFAIGAASRDAERDPGRTRAALDQVGAQLRQSMRQLRTLLVDLYPDSLHRQGLEGALTDLLARAEQHSITTSLHVADGPVPTAAAEAVLYRTAQEALRNVMNHSGATRVDVHLAAVGDHWELTVTDDGRGFDGTGVLAGPTVPKGHGGDDRPRFGLRMLRDLAADHHGRLTLDSAPGSGTTLTLSLPLETR